MTDFDPRGGVRAGRHVHARSSRAGRRASRKPPVRILLAVLLVGLVRCGGDAPTLVVDPEDPVATTIEVSPSALHFLSLGQTVEVTARVLDQFGGQMTATVRWTTSDHAVATVDARGRVTSQGVGPAVITVTSGGATTPIPVLSGQAPVRVEVSPEEMTLGGPGSEATFEATAFDAGGNEIPDATPGLTSLDETVATVSANGVVTAVDAGSTTIVVTMSNQGATAEAEVDVTVLEALAVAPVSIPSGTAGLAYELALSATGGDGTNYSWTVVSGSLPTGLTLAPNGEITGTPTVPGTADFTVEVANAGQTAQQALTIVVAEMLSVTTTTLPDGTEGESYGPQSLVATGGDGTNYSWTIATGSLPSGLVLATNGEIAGTPTVPGTVDFTVEVASAGQTAQQAFTMEVAPLLEITTTALPPGVDGVDYGTQSLAAVGGDGANYLWSLASGTLPAGLTLGPNGEITGTPTGSGTADFTVEVTSGGQTDQQTLSIVVAGPLAVTTTTVPNGFEGVSYGPQSLVATGGDGTNYTWTLASGALPAGLILAANGEITGTPTVPGMADFTVEVASAGQTAQKLLSIEVAELLEATTATLPDGVQGVDYGTATLTATGGDGITYAWSLVSGTLPDGLSLAGDGEITGTPTNAGTSSFTVEVASGTQTDQQPLSIIVTCELESLPDSDADGLPNCAETGTGVYLGVLDTGTDPFSSDTDNDGLGDGEEVLGTAGGLDLPAFGVSPLRMDLLLEYDWFEDDLSCGTHSHRPTAAIEARVTAAFAAAPVVNPDGTTGVNFIHDYGQGGVLSGGNMLSDADGVLVSGVSGSEFLSYKSANFAANREGYFHYVVMPHRYNTTSSSSGQAEVNGDDMIVSLQCSLSTNNVANTIAHELGHNLGLRHGGFENRNNKPNYNSVMNYDYQFPGVDDDCTPPGNGILDYSHGTRPPLNENSLQEPDGVCGGGVGSAWDWNGDGDALDLNVVVDLDGDGAFTTLTDFNDWAAINLAAMADFDGARLLATPEIVSCFDPTVDSDGS